MNIESELDKAQEKFAFQKCKGCNRIFKLYIDPELKKIYATDFFNSIEYCCVECEEGLVIKLID